MKGNRGGVKENGEQGRGKREGGRGKRDLERGKREKERVIGCSENLGLKITLIETVNK